MGSDENKTKDSTSRITIDGIALLTGVIGLFNLLISYMALLGSVPAAFFYADYVWRGGSVRNANGIGVLGMWLLAAGLRWTARGVLIGRRTSAFVAVLMMLTFVAVVGAAFASGIYTMEKSAVMLPMAAEAIVFALLVCRSFYRTRYWHRQK